MINAEEARYIATEFHNEQTKIQKDKIENVIIDAAKIGARYCQIKGYVYAEIRKLLEELGYTIKTDTVCNETWTYIGWE